jgi:hypothetical protein
MLERKAHVRAPFSLHGNFGIQNTILVFCSPKHTCPIDRQRDVKADERQYYCRFLSTRRPVDVSNSD